VCQILNKNPYMVTLKKGLKIAKVLNKRHILSVQLVEDTDHVDSQSEQVVTRAEFDRFHQSFGFKVSPTLDEDKRYQILELLYKYNSVFHATFRILRRAKDHH